MDTFKNWAFSVCCASVFCGLLNMILPEGNTNKIIKTVIYVFLLSVIVSFFAGFVLSDFDFISPKNETDYSYGKNEFNEISEKYMEEEIISATKEILNCEGIEAKDISLKVNISAEGSIDIIDFTLTLAENQNTKDISDKIIQKTGVEPKIIISGEN